MSRIGELTANIYELLDESDGAGVESGKKAQAVLDKKNTVAVAPVTKPSAAPNTQSNRKPQERRDRPQGERRAPRADGDRPPRTDRPPRAPRADGDRPPRTDRPPRNPDSPAEGRFPREPRGDRKPREPRGEGAPRAGKREFDRKSGTGRGKEVQKGGAGKGGWGNDQETAAHAEGHSAEEAVEELKKEENAGEETQPEAKVDVVEPEPEEKWGRTLDDFNKEKKKVGGDLAIRQLETDSSAYKGFETIKKVEENFFTVEKKQTEKKAKEGSKKNVVPADQVLRFQPEKKERPQREERPRGGERGRGKPNQAGEKRKPASSNQAAPKLDDFPTLSKA